MVHLYFASCTRNGGIYHYTLENQQLQFREKTNCDRPMYLDVTKESVQAVLRSPFESQNSQNSGLVEYPLHEDGSLGLPGEIRDTQGVVGCHLCRYKGQTYVANYISGNIFSSEGIVREHTGNGPRPDRQEGPHLHYVQPSPDGSCLLAVDLGTDSVYSYDARLQHLHTAHVPAGCGARHLAYSENGKIVFCVNELDSSVTVFTYKDTVLTPIQTVSTLEKENRKNTAAAIRVCGEYVYVSNRGEDSISCLRWDGQKLKLCSVTPCSGRSPRDFIIAEGLLFCTNENSDNVTIFRADGPAMEKLDQELPVPAPLCAAKLSG